MNLRFEASDFEALAEAMEPVVERVVVRALGDRRGGEVEAPSGNEEVRYLTRKQVAMAFGISPRSVDRYEELGQIPRRRQVGLRSVRWLEHEVREAVLKMPKGG
jgi:predicted DNA-binding transcriptional regulator AlpA